LEQWDNSIANEKDHFMHSNETVLLELNDQTTKFEYGMKNTGLDNQIQQCARSYKIARKPLVQVHELNKKIIVLRS
jgi:hypothetical protein